MSSVSLPVTRPAGRGVVVGHPASRGQPLEMLRQMGFTCAEADDPYAAMGELCRGPADYKAVVLSLAGVYAEELELIAAIKQRHPAVEVWLADADGRQAALAEAVRLGADGVADDDGFHRVAVMQRSEGRTRGPRRPRCWRRSCHNSRRGGDRGDGARPRLANVAARVRSPNGARSKELLHCHGPASGSRLSANAVRSTAKPIRTKWRSGTHRRRAARACCTSPRRRRQRDPSDP